MADDTLRARFDSIADIARATSRGLALERLLAEIFRQHHFNVSVGAGVARPRQTDVFATKVSESYLIESKWRVDKANVDDIDSLRSRLRRTTGDVVGILVSVAGFTGSVLHDVEHDRQRTIVLVSGDELRRVVDTFESLPDLLWRKKEAMLRDGKVLLDEPDRKRRTRRRGVVLPRSECRFVRSGGERSQVIECNGGFGQFVFAHQLADIDWFPARGVGVALDFSPAIHDERGLLDLIERLAALGWATPDARWSIQQARKNWHGLGCAAFADALPSWPERAKTPFAHHSEEICYLDLCDQGFYTLTATLSAHRIRQARMVGLSFQLEGIPLDTGPLLQLCRSVGVHDNVSFRPRSQKSVQRHIGHPLIENVEAIGYLITPDGEDPVDWVTGILITNPYRRSATHPDMPGLPDGAEHLVDSELLVCDLAEHHLFDDQPREYYLRGIEHAWTSDAMVCRPIANWK